jgi:hypothetical protein
MNQHTREEQTDTKPILRVSDTAMTWFSACTMTYTLHDIVEGVRTSGRRALGTSKIEYAMNTAKQKEG